MSVAFTSGILCHLLCGRSGIRRLPLNSFSDISTLEFGYRTSSWFTDRLHRLPYPDCRGWRPFPARGGSSGLWVLSSLYFSSRLIWSLVGIWGFRASLECMIPLVKTILSIKPPSYQAVLDLDHKIRNLVQPPSHPGDPSDDRTAASMRAFVRTHYQDLSEFIKRYGCLPVYQL